MKRLSLFGKVYLVVLATLFLPAFTFYWTDRWIESDKIRQAMLNFEDSRFEIDKIVREIAEEFEILAYRSMTDDNSELMRLWIQEKRLSSGLDIYITHTDPELGVFEDFAVTVDRSGVRIAPPLATVATSASGRTVVFGVQQPYEDWDELRTPLPGRLFLLMGIIGALISYFMVRHFMHPLRELVKATERITHGNFSARVDDAAIAGQDELRKLGATFNVMAAHVQNLLESQKQLLIDISHELRSPLQRLHVMFALIETDGKEHIDPINLRRVEEDVRNIDAMIEELLTMAHAESSLLEYEQEEIFLKDYLLSIVESENFDWREEGKSAEFTGEDLRVLGNAKLLDRAMRNVIRNAMKYSPAGGKVEISLAKDEGEAVLRVKDHGCGVAEEDLEKIFLPFYRSKRTRDLASGGSGLGLPMVRRILESHRGSCVASNSPDGGLLMTLRLPLLIEFELQK